jgi:hypothetical protein
MKKNHAQDLEAESVAAWIALRRMPDRRRRTLYLTPRRHVVWYEHRITSPLCVEIGTYNNEVELQNLQEDVLWADANLGRDGECP